MGAVGRGGRTCPLAMLHEPLVIHLDLGCRLDRTGSRQARYMSTGAPQQHLDVLPGAGTIVSILLEESVQQFAYSPAELGIQFIGRHRVRRHLQQHHLVVRLALKHELAGQHVIQHGAE